jgi:hypothetical protein
MKIEGGFDVLLGCLNLAAFIFAVYFYTKSQEETFNNSSGGNDTSTNKYRKPLQVAPDNWYYRFFKLKYRERFPLSGSFLVALTDKYHRYQMFFKILLCVSIVLYRPLFGLLDGIIYFVFWGVVFTASFRN